VPPTAFRKFLLRKGATALAEERAFPTENTDACRWLIGSPEQNQQEQERGRRQQREKGQRGRQNSSRIFGNGVDVQDDPADREKRERPPENQVYNLFLARLMSVFGALTN